MSPVRQSLVSLAVFAVFLTPSAIAATQTTVTLRAESGMAFYRNGQEFYSRGGGGGGGRGINIAVIHDVTGEVEDIRCPTLRSFLCSAPINTNVHPR